MDDDADAFRCSDDFRVVVIGLTILKILVATVAMLIEAINPTRLIAADRG